MKRDRIRCPPTLPGWRLPPHRPLRATAGARLRARARILLPAMPGSLLASRTREIPIKTVGHTTNLYDQPNSISITALSHIMRRDVRSQKKRILPARQPPQAPVPTRQPPQSTLERCHLEMSAQESSYPSPQSPRPHTTAHPLLFAEP